MEVKRQETKSRKLVLPRIEMRIANRSPERCWYQGEQLVKVSPCQTAIREEAQEAQRKDAVGWIARLDEEAEVGTTSDAEVEPGAGSQRREDRQPRSGGKSRKSTTARNGV